MAGLWYDLYNSNEGDLEMKDLIEQTCDVVVMRVTKFNGITDYTLFDALNGEDLRLLGAMPEFVSLKADMAGHVVLTMLK